jgi:hypothetical protein
MIHALPLALLLLLPACAATAEGQWPSLARRPGEVDSGSPSVAPAAAPTASATTGDASAAAVAAGRIAGASKDFEQLTASWRQQRDQTEAAVAAARGTAASSQPWSRAQLELTRLERLGSEISELRERLNAVAGDLALAAAQGSEVAAALGQAGQLIARIEAARAEHLQSFETAQRALAR